MYPGSRARSASRTALASRGQLGRFGHHVRRQPLVAHHHHRVADARDPAQRRLDLPELDPQAPQLDLEVDPPQELDRSVARRAMARQVAGPVQPRTRNRRERIGDEALGRERRATQISARHLDPADVQLARHAHRHRRHRRRSRTHAARVGDRPARSEPGARRRPAGLRADDSTRTWCTAVGPYPLTMVTPGTCAYARRTWAGDSASPPISTSSTPASASGASSITVLKTGGGQPDRRDPVSADEVADRGRRRVPRGQKDAAASVQQRPPQLEGRGVE